MKTAIYARKSTKKDGQKETIENQIKICKRFAIDNKLNIVDIKTDSATGTDDINRPEVKELINDALKGKYECVIMKGISRLYRDTEKGLGLIKMLDRNDIRVITVEEMFDSKEHRTSTGKLDLSRITMYLMFSEMESKKLADRIKYTQIEKAHAGEWNQAGSIPFGYKYNSTTKKLEIDYTQSPVIRLIFDLYCDGMGMKSIAHYLNGGNQENKKYPSPKSKRWSEYTIGFILKNEVYIGSVVYNKRSKRERSYKCPEMLGKSSSDIYVGNDYNEKEDWIITKNAHPAIIEEDIFSKVQEIISTKAKRKGIRNNVSLLAGILKCGKCGSGMTFKRGRKDKHGKVVTRNNYYCMNYIRYGKQYCTSHHIRASEIEKVIIDDLKSFLNNEKLLNDIFKNIKINKSYDDLVNEKNRIENEITRVADLMDKLLVKNLEGDINNQQFRLMNSNYSERLKILTDELEKVEISISNNNNEDINMNRFKNDLKLLINFEDQSTEEKRYRILKLVDTVTFHENGELEITYPFENQQNQ